MTTLTQTMRRTLVRAMGESMKMRLHDLPIALTYAAHPRAMGSLRRLTQLKDAYKGQRCFIIGNGPSLRETNLALLRNEVTFGLNRIYLLFEELGFSTTFLVSVNENVIQQFGDELLAQPMPKFLSWRSRRYLPASRDDVSYLLPSKREEFSENPLSHGIWEGATVTFVAMQLAFYMGFEQAVLVGVDHSFVTTGTPHQLVTAQGPDPNHFSPAYFGAGVRWQLPDLETSERAYRLADARYRQSGREIIDATVGGHLQVFPKRRLEDFF
jgi:hypothetical protein